MLISLCKKEHLTDNYKEMDHCIKVKLSKYQETKIIYQVKCQMTNRERHPNTSCFLVLGRHS